jgi:hypothetical protein
MTAMNLAQASDSQMNQILLKPSVSMRRIIVLSSGVRNARTAELDWIYLGTVPRYGARLILIR